MNKFIKLTEFYTSYVGNGCDDNQLERKIVVSVDNIKNIMQGFGSYEDSKDTTGNAGTSWIWLYDSCYSGEHGRKELWVKESVLEIYNMLNPITEIHIDKPIERE